jgi:hypothetical protein
VQALDPWLALARDCKTFAGMAKSKAVRGGVRLGSTIAASDCACAQQRGRAMIKA